MFTPHCSDFHMAIGVTSDQTKPGRKPKNGGSLSGPAAGSSSGSGSGGQVPPAISTKTTTKVCVLWGHMSELPRKTNKEQFGVQCH